MLTEDWKSGGFGIYVHWPFCQSKCPYCDFNSHVASSVDQKRWEHAFCAEIERSAQLLPNRHVNTIFFGGGTPSLMSPDLVGAIVDKVKSFWSLANDVEISLEANPTSVEAGRFAGFRDAGVNRISMGIQSLNDEDLKRLGRLHTAKDAMHAFDIARSVFDRVSFDLIYARQDQSLDDWRAELSTALSLSLDHLSLYQLTIENGTAFGALHKLGRLRGLPSDDLSADMYELTQDLCSAYGLDAYEVSNHAKSGAQSKHNLIYWRSGDYLGLGPGAHGRLTVDGHRFATETHLSPEKWLSEVEEKGTGLTINAEISSQDQADEYLMMSLRLSEGTDILRYNGLATAPLKAAAIKNLVDLELVSVVSDRLIATVRGRTILNSLLRALMAD